MADNPEDPPPEKTPEETPEDPPEGEEEEPEPVLGVILFMIAVFFPIALMVWFTRPWVPTLLGLRPLPQVSPINPRNRAPQGNLGRVGRLAEHRSKALYGRSIPTTTREVISSIHTISTFMNDAICNQGAVSDGETQKFLPLCTFSCAHGYCPSPCICTGYGKESRLPPDTGVQACRIQGTEEENDILCAFACAHGYCPSESCTTGCEETNGKMNKLE